MPEYAFTFGGRPCVIKTCVQVEVGGRSGFVAFSFAVQHNGYSLRPVEDGDGEARTFFARTEEGVLALACEGLARQFGPRSDAWDPPKIPTARRVHDPACVDRRKALTTLALTMIRADDYVVVTEKGAMPLAHTSWPGAGAILGRALEAIEAGHRGRVRDVLSTSSADHPAPGPTRGPQPVLAALQRYAGWLKPNKVSIRIRGAVDALGTVLEQDREPLAIAAAVGKVGAEVERLYAPDLKRLFRKALRDLRLTLNLPKDDQ
jgi:hypothetical protein